jgi:hypothetical protein
MVNQGILYCGLVVVLDRPMLSLFVCSSFFLAQLFINCTLHCISACCCIAQGPEKTFPLALCCEARQLEVVIELLRHPRINVYLEKVRLSIFPILLSCADDGNTRLMSYSSAFCCGVGGFSSARCVNACNQLKLHTSLVSGRTHTHAITTSGSLQ